MKKLKVAEQGQQSVWSAKQQSFSFNNIMVIKHKNFRGFITTQALQGSQSYTGAPLSLLLELHLTGSDEENQLKMTFNEKY